MNTINYPETLILTNGKKITTVKTEPYRTSEGLWIYEFEQDKYVICLFKDIDNRICADVCYTGISTYTDFDNLDLSEASYKDLNMMN